MNKFKSLCLFTLQLFACSLSANNDTKCGNNKIAGDLIHSIQNHPQQQRNRLECNEKLNEVALIKAKLILENENIWHNAGNMTPNQLLRQHGFQLPRTYPHFGNQVEALAGGEETANLVFSDFLQSEPHRKLLLGEDAFFKSQDQIGAAFIKDLSTEHEYYWVVIIADEKNHTIKQNPVIEVEPPVLSKKKSKRGATRDRLYRRKVKGLYNQQTSILQKPQGEPVLIKSILQNPNLPTRDKE